MVRETAIKLVTCWYYTSLRLSKIFPQSSPLCFRGFTHQGSFLHLFWECEKLQPTWKEVLKLIDKLAGKTISLTYQHCILFQTPPDSSKPFVKLIHSICIAMHWAIALQWKTPLVPFTQIVARIDDMMLADKIYHTLHDSIPHFDAKWNP